MKRILCVLMICALLLAALPLTASADGDDPGVTPPEIPTTGDVWDGVTITQPTKLVQKDGVYFYEITKCAELAYVAQTGGVWTGKNYLLANDLILNDVILSWNEDGMLLNTAPLNKWTPIGNGQTPFNGTLDGGGHTISGLYISHTDTAGVVGLSKGTVRSLTVVNAYVSGSGGLGGICGQGGSCIDCTYSGAVVGGRDYIGGICGSIWGGTCIGCTSYGLVMGSRYVGGICGYQGCSDCTNYSTVSGNRDVGGICGDNVGADVTNCVNYGTVNGGTERVAGICGNFQYETVSNCRNYGEINGGSHVGGICGEGRRCIVTGCANNGAVTGGGATGGICGYLSAYQNNITDCANYGEITGKRSVGGIVGSLYNSYDTRYPSGTIAHCANAGSIAGTDNVGGVCGIGDYETLTVISDSYNTGKTTGDSNVGGIAGQLINDTVTNCYSVGSVDCTVAENNAGMVIGSDGAIWGSDTVTGCFYLATEGVFGCGGVISASMEAGGIRGKTAAELKQLSTYTGWDVTDIWSINPDLNGGYPYLRWQEEEDVSVIPLTGLSFSQETLSLGADDVAYFSVNAAPATATLPELTWESKDESVATVNNYGRVTAVGEGTAKIVVSGGGFSAECAVTVKSRAAKEYRIGELTVRNPAGQAQTAIPSGSFLVTIPITKQADGGNGMVFLAAYTASGQYRGLLYASVEDVPIGATVRITLPVDNAKGDIARLKVFPIVSFSDPTPLGEAVGFPLQ